MSLSTNVNIALVGVSVQSTAEGFLSAAGARTKSMLVAHA
eukprot:SAG31_NODE_42437_length_271_cov_1.354651_1_plen_39_part_01